MTLDFKNSIFHKMFKNRERRSLALSRECKGADEMEAADTKGKHGQSQQSVAETSGIHD